MLGPVGLGPSGDTGRPLRPTPRRAGFRRAERDRLRLGRCRWGPAKRPLRWSRWSRLGHRPRQRPSRIERDSGGRGRPDVRRTVWSEAAAVEVGRPMGRRSGASRRPGPSASSPVRWYCGGCLGLKSTMRKAVTLVSDGKEEEHRDRQSALVGGESRWSCQGPMRTHILQSVATRLRPATSAMNCIICRIKHSLGVKQRR